MKTSSIPSSVRPRVRSLGVILVAVGCFGSFGCSNGGNDVDGGDSATSTSSVVVEGALEWSEAEPQAVPESGDAFCPPSMPGEEMSAAEAVVRFSPSQICPGYVTVRPGTLVTFENLGDAAVKVTITDGPKASAKELTATELAPKQAMKTTFESPGSVYYLVSSIESFRGTIEVLGK